MTLCRASNFSRRDSEVTLALLDHLQKQSDLGPLQEAMDEARMRSASPLLLGLADERALVRGQRRDRGANRTPPKHVS